MPVQSERNEQTRRQPARLEQGHLLVLLPVVLPEMMPAEPPQHAGGHRQHQLPAGEPDWLQAPFRSHA